MKSYRKSKPQKSSRNFMVNLCYPKFYLPLLLLFLALITPIFVKDPYIILVLMELSGFILYSSSWNMLTFSGQGSLGHSAFLGIGGYVSAIATTAFSKTLMGYFSWAYLFTSLIAGAAFSAAIGFLVGLSCVRLREWFLGMVTFGFIVIAEVVTIVPLEPITKGAYGLAVPPLLPSIVHYYYYGLILTFVSVVIIHVILQSRTGLAFAAVREDELVAKTLGINTAKYRLLAFAISTFFAGLAGAFNANYIHYISPDVYSPWNSFQPLIISIIGGLGTSWGPVVGSTIFLFFWECLRPPILDPVLRMIAIGLILILEIIFLPRGIYPLIYKHLKMPLLPFFTKGSESAQTNSS